MNVEDQDMRHYPSESVALQADRWLARLRSPDCGASDRRRFQEWLAQAPMHWQAYNQAEQLWSAAAQAQDAEMQAMADAILLRARQRRRAAPARIRMLGWAAAVVVMVGVASGVWKSGWLTPEPSAVMYSTAIGEIRSFTLPDGSVITLGTDTILQASMGKRARLVSLQRGEAQFKVAADAARPFTVRTSQAGVTAIGTVFQVRSIDATTEVSLLEGRVRVLPADTEKNTGTRQDLTPGERLVAKAGTPWVRGRTDLETVNGWLSGRLVFDSTPLSQAVSEFNRYSQRKLRIADPAIGDIRIEGVFNAGDTDSIALALRYAYPLRVEDRGTELVLSRK
jgi:transmembrane sensor